MPYELGLWFDDPAHVVVFLNEDGETQSAPAQPFTGPLDHEAQRDLPWYLEVYPAQYTTELDDDRAARIGQRIPDWGKALFDAVFADREAARLFDRFQDGGAEGKLLTVSSGRPTVLAQPWSCCATPTRFPNQPELSPIYPVQSVTYLSVGQPAGRWRGPAGTHFAAFYRSREGNFVSNSLLAGMGCTPGYLTGNLQKSG
jgi:hypothetical protein